MFQVDEEISFRMSQAVDSPQKQDSMSQMEQTNSSSISLSQSLFSQQNTPVSRSAADKEEIFKDRFNGILYHVIPTNGQITILFSSRDLYMKFLDSLNKELHPKPITDTRSTYQTHIRGKWCTLTTDNNVASISAKGPGQTLWRQTVFLRLAIRLYQQYANETDQEINSSQVSQTSTPSSVGQIRTSPPVSPVPFQSNIQQVPLPAELTEQITELKQISKLLQEQLNSVNTKLDILVQKSLDTSHFPSVNEISDTTLDEQPQYVTINATTESQPSLHPGPSSYSDVVSNNPPKEKEQQRSKHHTEISVVQERENENMNSSSANKNHVSSQERLSFQSERACSKERLIQRESERQMSQILIIGDSILSGVNRKGLVQGIECRSIPGATMDTLTEKIKLYDLSKFTDIVVYIGGNDSSRNTDIEYFEEKYEQFLSYVKEKNQTGKIYLCTPCPRGDTDVSDINDVIFRLCEEHEVMCISTNAAFYDKHNTLRTHFYKERDNIHLSRSGVKRLLGTINQTLHIVDNFDHCAYSVSPLHSR